MENVLNKEKSIGKFFRYKVDEQFANYLSVIKYSAEKGEYVTIFFDNRRYDNPCPIGTFSEQYLEWLPWEEITKEEFEAAFNEKNVTKENNPAVSRSLSSDFLEYLYAWISTREEKYSPIILTDVQKAFSEFLSIAFSIVIDKFKKSVEDGKLQFDTVDSIFIKNHEDELYEKSLEYIKQFEEKYHIKNEKNK